MKKLVIGALAAVIGALAMISTAGADAHVANVRVAHGIPGQDLGLEPALPVDVLVNDSICLLEGFTFGEFAGPVELAPGTYNIKISLASSPACENAPVIEADVPFDAGEDATVIAHLSEAGDPTASKFVNDLSRTGSVESRLIVHHTAAAPMVDIEVRRPSRFGPTLNIDDFSNGDQASAEAWPGRWKVSIAPAGATDPVFGPIPFNVRPFKTYLVYAVGSVDTGSFTLLVEPLRTGSGFSWR